MNDALTPSAEQSAALAALPADAPVVMINLLRFKKPGGLEHFLRYGQEVAPLMKRAGATIRWSGFAQAVILGDGDSGWWDAIVVVEYPSPTAFNDMVTSSEYGQIYRHREAAVDRGDLIATSMWPRQQSS